MEEEKDREDVLFAYCISGWSGLWVPRECLLELGARIKQCFGRRKFGGEDLCDLLKMGPGEEKEAAGGCLNIPDDETGELDLNKRDMEGLWLVYLFP